MIASSICSHVMSQAVFASSAPPQPNQEPSLRAYPEYTAGNWNMFLDIARANRSRIEASHPGILQRTKRKELIDEQLRSALVSLTNSKSFAIMRSESEQEILFGHLRDAVRGSFSIGLLPKFGLAYHICYGLSASAGIVLGMNSKPALFMHFSMVFLLSTTLSWRPYMKIKKAPVEIRTQANVSLTRYAALYSYVVGIASYVGASNLSATMPFHMPAAFAIGLTFAFLIPMSFYDHATESYSEELGSIMKDFKEGKLKKT